MNTKTHLSTRQHQFLQRAGMLSFATLLLGVGTASAQQNHFLHAVADPTWLDSSTLRKHQCIQAVDIDGDMDIDLFLADGGYGSRETIFFKNEGSPTNPSLIIQSTRYGLENHPTNSMVFGDLDNDGDKDVLYRKYNPYVQDSIFYLANQGTSTAPDFSGTARHLFNIPFASYLYSMSLADLDNDGDLDLLTHDQDTRTMTYYTNSSQTSPSFTSASLPSGLASQPAIVQFALVDMDNDGDLDIWKTTEYPSPGEISFSTNTGSISTPTFSSFQTFPMGVDSVFQGTTDRVVAAVTAPFDIDDDGDIDLLSYNSSNNIYINAIVFENTKCDTNNTAPVVTQSSNTISTGAGLSSYQWYSVDAQGVRTPVQGATNATFAPATDGSYTVRAKKTNGCVAYSADFAFVHIGVNSVADANLWNISPNPVTSELFVQSDLTWLRWEIIDAQGRVIRTIAKPTTNSINVSELPQGIYTLRGQAADGKSAISRFVKK